MQEHRQVIQEHRQVIQEHRQVNCSQDSLQEARLRRQEIHLRILRTSQAEPYQVEFLPFAQPLDSRSFYCNTRSRNGKDSEDKKVSS